VTGLHLLQDAVVDALFVAEADEDAAFVGERGQAQGGAVLRVRCRRFALVGLQDL
jgi:hypothetical protein